MLNGLDLFSGIGGNTIALSEYVRTVAYCEKDTYAQSVLLSRMGAGDIPKAPIWDDVTTMDGRIFNLPIDIIVGGFPCQDISTAGNGVGLEGERSGLFFEIIRISKEIKPTFLFLENVPGIRTKGLDQVVGELSDAGYDCRWCLLSASEMGAPHERKRWFCLANAKSIGWGERWPEFDSRKRITFPASGGPPLADTVIGGDWWKFEPALDRVVNGIPHRVDRIKCLGNSVVPAQAKKAFEILMFGDE